MSGPITPQGPPLPKSLSIFVTRPGKELYEVTVEFDDAKGRLADLLGCLPEPGCSVVALHVAPLPHAEAAGTARAPLLARLHLAVTPPIDAEAIRHCLEGKAYVLGAIVRSGLSGVLIDSSFPLYLTERARAIVLDAHRASDMLDNLRLRMGSGGAVLMYEQGRAYGESAGAAYVRTFGSAFLRTHPEYALRLFTAMGWGETELLEYDFDHGTARLTMRDGFECRSQRSPIPYSQFIRGCLAGVISAVTDRIVDCTETHCIAQGDDRCEFAIRPRA